MSKLAQNLVLLRKKNNLTQDEIAQKMYVSRQAVSKWERGESEPDVDTLAALSDFFSVTVDKLLKDDLSESPCISVSENIEQNFDDLKKLRKRQTAKLMIVWSIALLGIYAWLCGILQIALYDTLENIWICWLTLPVVPPIIFAIRFRREIGKKWLMFFVDVPFIAGIIYLFVVFSGNFDGAWLAFLIIPIYYAVAVGVCLYQFKLERDSKKISDTNSVGQ